MSPSTNGSHKYALEVIDDDEDNKVISEALRSHRQRWDGCTKCPIGQTAFKHVFGRGVLPCDILFIGEAPGKTEDLLGYPFVGRSGTLLDFWIKEMWDTFPACGDLTFAITNTVLCRPCDRAGGPNRAPHDKEMANCDARLTEFIEYVAMPDLIITLGKSAENAIRKRGFHAHCQVEALPHPAWVLRNGGHGSITDKSVMIRFKAIMAGFIKDNA